MAALLLALAYFLPVFADGAALFENWQWSWPTALGALLVLGSAAAHPRGRRPDVLLGVVSGIALSSGLDVANYAAYFALVGDQPGAGFWVWGAAGAVLFLGLVVALRREHPGGRLRRRRGRRAVTGAVLAAVGWLGYGFYAAVSAPPSAAVSAGLAFLVFLALTLLDGGSGHRTLWTAAVVLGAVSVIGQIAYFVQGVGLDLFGGLYVTANVLSVVGFLVSRTRARVGTSQP